MKFVKRMAVGSMAVVTATAMSAHAQFMPQMAGTGYNMGQQGCNQQVQAGAGAASYLDEYNEIKKALAEEKRRFSDLRKKERDLRKEVSTAKSTIVGSIDDNRSEMILEHIENGRLCSDYRGYEEPREPQPLPPPPRSVQPVVVPVEPAPAPAPPPKKGKTPGVRKDKDKTGDTEKAIAPAGKTSSITENQSRMPADERSSRSRVSADENVDVEGGGQEKLTPIHGFTTAEWQRACLPGKRGAVRGGVCKTYRSARSKFNENDCKLALIDYREKLAEQEANTRDMAESKALQERYRKDLPIAMRDAKERYKDDTESGICVDCIANGNGYVTQKSGPNWPSVAANGVVAGLAMYMGYKTNKMVAEYNSDLGWPTQATPAWGYGLPFAANAIYGALGGGTGSGTFGCAGANGNGNGLYGNMGMNGPFGYPQGMFGGQMGGGMYNGGMGPYGVPGPWGLGGGGQMGMPGYGMMMSGGLMMGGMSPYGQMGGMSPYGAFMSGGLGAMSPYGQMMGGQMMGGQMMGGQMMGGQMMGGQMMGGQMMGGQMMGGGMDPQYQQAMMQMQMQQQQMYMQQQQQQAQNQMARQQTYMGLAQQMSELQMKMQMVMSGSSINVNSSFGTSGYGGNYTGSGSVYNTIGGGNPSVPIPAPGGFNNSQGGGVGGGTIIPAGSR